jgi:quercetin dioxygenase-like cupin family protein
MLLGALVVVALTATGGARLATAARDTPTGVQSGRPAVFHQVAPNVPLASFEATGLPAGTATGVARRTTAPPGFVSKHSHGGPLYAFVISGSIELIDADGNRKTYRPGEFYWERPGEPHTAQTAEGVELFIVQFLTPGALATIPAQ